MVTASSAHVANCDGSSLADLRASIRIELRLMDCGFIVIGCYSTQMSKSLASLNIYIRLDPDNKKIAGA